MTKMTKEEKQAARDHLRDITDAWESFGKFPTMSAAADYYNRATIHGGAA
jgi:hypothetical protein